MKPLRRGLALALLPPALLVAGCSRPDAPAGTEATSTASATASPESASATPGGFGSDSASPGEGTPGSASPATPGVGSASPLDSASPEPSLATCTAVAPIRASRAELAPRRTMETVLIVSDGRGLTPGTRDQEEFLAPVLTGPDGTTITDEQTVAAVGTLLLKQRQRVLLARPDAPDADADAGRKPFNTPGTYVLFTATRQLLVDVTVDCSGQRQEWSFTAEANLSRGQVNCAIEPSRSTGLARQVYQDYCV